MPVLVEPDSQRAAAMAAMLSDGAHVVASLDHLDSWLQGRPDAGHHTSRHSRFTADAHGSLTGSDHPVHSARM